MDDETLEALRGFGGVWGRVEGRAEAAPALGDLAEAASRQCELLSALARVCPRSSARLRRMASEEAALAARLRAEDFLAGGGGRAAAAACAVVRNPLCGLREAYNAASALGEALQAAANAAPCALRRALDPLAAGGAPPRLRAARADSARDVRKLGLTLPLK